MDRLTPRIVELRAALEKRVGAYGAMKGVPITPEAYSKMVLVRLTGNLFIAFSKKVAQ